MKDMTRSKVIQIWFAAVALIAVAGVAFGASVTVGTAAVLLVLCLVPGAIIWMLWPGDPSRTVGDVLRGTDRRP
jgi:hypothetical protein